MKIRRFFCALLTLCALLTALPGNALEPETSDASAPVIALLGKGFSHADHTCFSDGLTGAPSLDETRCGALTDTPGVWYSPLFPFSYDYAEQDADVSAEEERSGDAAAALIHKSLPEAQLLRMKIYGASGGTTNAAVCDALRDALRLGASIVVADLTYLPAAAQGEPTIAGMLEELRASGVLVICPAGDRGAVGWGSVYASQAGESGSPAAQPDTGTLPMAAMLPSVLTVASVDSPDVEDRTLLCAGREIGYTDSNPNYQTADGRSFRQVFGDALPALAVVPGAGSPEDYSRVDVRGKLVLIQRGTLSFTEKINNAHAAGASGVIVYNITDEDAQSIGMDLTGALLPAVLISASDGYFLLSHAQEKLYFRQTAGEIALSFTSSRGPASDLSLKPTLCAVGGAVQLPNFLNEKDASYSSSLHAACEAAISAARLRMQLPDASPALLEQLLASGAEILEEDGVPLSPRKQGSGLLRRDALPCALLSSSDGAGAISLGDDLRTAFVLRVRIANPSEEQKTYQLSAVPLRESVYQPDTADLPVFLSDRDEALDETRVWLGDTSKGNLNRTASDYAPLSLTLEGGEETELALYVRLSSAEAASFAADFPNGGYLEGYLLAECGVETASIAFMGFSGDYDALRVWDGTLYEGDYFYAGDRLFSYENDLRGIQEVTLGEALIDGQILSDADMLFFSPGRDGLRDAVYLRFTPIRALYDLRFTVYDDSGAVVHRYRNPVSLPATASSNSTPYSLYVWDGSADDNPNYFYPDGVYTLVLSARASADGAPQKRTLHLRVDTKKPRLTDFSVSDGTLCLTFEDESGIASLSVRDSAGNYFTLGYTGRRDSVLRVENLDISDASGDYLYLEAYDYAGNRTVTRQQLPEETK